MPSSTNENLTDKVYQKIKKMMINYEIIPGQRLIFSDLAKRMGVSRTPVNNALSILASEGFLDFVPNQGYTVHQITQEEAESLYEIRLYLEVGAIEKVIKNLTAEKAKELDNHRLLFEEAVADNLSRERFILGQEFHLSILSLADNTYLPHYYTEVYQRIFLRHRVESLRSGRAKCVIQEHRDILKAIKKKDAESAKKFITAHIEAEKEYIFAGLFPDDRIVD